MSKKFLAILLALVMVFSLMPITALAAGDEPVAEPDIVAAGFYADNEKADAAIVKLGEENDIEVDVTGVNASNTDTIFVAIKNLKDDAYTLKLKAPDGTYLSCSDDEHHGVFDFETTSPKDAYVVRGTFNTYAEEGALIKDKDNTDQVPVAEGKYTFEIYNVAPAEVTETTEPVDTMDVIIGKLTVGENPSVYFDTAVRQTVGEFFPDIDGEDDPGVATFAGWVVAATETPVLTTAALKEVVLTETVTYVAKMEPIPLTEIEVTAFDGATGLGDISGSDLQTGLNVSADGTTYKFTGSSNYIFDWDDFDGRDEKNDGNFIAIKLAPAKEGITIGAVAAADTMKVDIDGVTLGSDGVYVVILDGSHNYVSTVTVTVGAEGSQQTATYKLNFKSVSRLPAAITDVANTDVAEGAVKASLKDGKIALAGIVEKDEVSGELADITLNVTFGDVEKSVVLTLKENSKGSISVTADPAELGGNELKFDTSLLAVKSETAADVATVAPPTAAVSDKITDETKAEKAGDIATALADGTVATPSEVDETVLQKYADVHANDAEAKTSLVSDAKAVVTGENAAKVPDTLKTAVSAADAADTLSTVVQVYTKMEVTGVETDGSSNVTGFTVNITPMAQTVVTTVAADGDLTSIKTFDDTKTKDENTAAGANAIVVKEEPVKVNEPTDVLLALPAGTFTAGTVYVKHTKDNGSTYVYEGTLTNESGYDKLIFTSEHGFSEFEITAENPTVAKIGAVGYTSLAAAFKDVKDGETIELVKNEAPAAKSITISGSSRTFTIDATSAALATEAALKAAIKNGDDVVVTDNEDGTFTVTYTKPRNTSSDSTGANTTVSVPSAEGGRVSVSNSSARKGDTVTITASPATGNKVGTVVVTDENGKTVDVKDAGNNKYTFVMPEGKVTVKVTFVKEDGTPVSGPEFTDVAEDAYYADAVKWAVENGITQGLTDTTFGPDASCTRAQMVTFLWRQAGSPKAEGTNPFADVASDAYYYDAVMWAVANGITQGATATTFDPDATVSRAQSVTFLYRAAGTPAADAGTAFTDVAADAYYAGAVAWAAANGITQGTTDTTFSPDNACVRAQIVTFMFRQSQLGA